MANTPATIWNEFWKADCLAWSEDCWWHLMLCQCKRDNNHEYHLWLEFPGLSESIRIKCMKIFFVSGSHGMVITTETFQSMFAYVVLDHIIRRLERTFGKPSNLFLKRLVSRLLIILAFVTCKKQKSWSIKRLIFHVFLRNTSEKSCRVHIPLICRFNLGNQTRSYATS